MNWKQHLFKPKWQNKSADVRLEAVKAGQDPQLFNELVEIASSDVDSRVRSAAIRRLHQLENILKLYPHETDPQVKLLLEDRIRHLTTSTGDTPPALKLRLQVVSNTTDRVMIEHLAQQAPEAELRRAALAKIERQGLLGDCCIADSDAENRRYAASRINQHTTLKRVIETLRKKDKALYIELRQRMHRELLKKADPGAIHTEAVNLCVALEKHALGNEQEIKSETASLHKAWQHIAPNVTEDLAQRYLRVADRLSGQTTRAKPAAKVEIAKPTESTEQPQSSPDIPVTAPVSEANRELVEHVGAIKNYAEENSDSPRKGDVGRLRHRLDRIWSQCRAPHSEDQDHWHQAGEILTKLDVQLDKQRQQKEELLQRAQALLAEYLTQLENGALHKALESRAGLQRLGKEIDQHDALQEIRKKLSGTQGRLRELREWHHWSNNKIRKRLIAEMEILPAADLHPDALIDRVKSLQAEWKVLEKSEQIPGDKHFSAAPRMWREFSTAGNAAFDTVRPFLDKRSEIQSRHAQSLATFCVELEQISETDPTDWVDLQKAITRGRRKLRKLDKVPAKQRQKLARRLKTALDKANSAMQGHYQLVEREKMKLIRAASQLVYLPERSDAIAQAKSLQSDWKRAGRVWRSLDQKLWSQFREHLDPLFNELKEQQASIKTADEENLNAQKLLCKNLKAILNEGEDLPSQQGKIQGLQDAWKELAHPDRRLADEFQSMVENYQQLVNQQNQKQAEADRQRWWNKSALLHEISIKLRDNTDIGPLTTGLKKSWPETGSKDGLEVALDGDYEDLLAGNPGNQKLSETKMIEQARELCIRMEFVAGLPSPNEDQEQRMKYQVDRLAESMSGESVRISAIDEALAAEKNWLGMYALPEKEFKLYGERVKQALLSILENN